MSEDTRGAAQWLDDNGQPDYEYLQSLVDDGGEDAMNELREIADLHDIEYDNDTQASDLMSQIVMILEEEPGHEAM